MSERIGGYVAVALLIGLSFMFQVQLKILANEIVPLLDRSDLSPAAKGWQTLRAAYGWRSLFIGVLALSLFLLWFLTLTRLDLSVALPVASLALVINAIGSGILLGEALSALRVLGVVFVAIGLVMVLKS